MLVQKAPTCSACGARIQRSAGRICSNLTIPLNPYKSPFNPYESPIKSLFINIKSPQSRKSQKKSQLPDLQRSVDKISALFCRAARCTSEPRQPAVLMGIWGFIEETIGNSGKQNRR